jgi:hypothetical protein
VGSCRRAGRGRADGLVFEERCTVKWNEADAWFKKYGQEINVIQGENGSRLYVVLSLAGRTVAATDQYEGIEYLAQIEGTAGEFK